MPRKVEWIHRIPAALDELRACSLPWIDRRTLERMLGISPRHSLRILQRMGPTVLAHGLVIGREDLIQKLERVLGGEDAVYERHRLERMDEQLAKARRMLAARSVPIAVSPAERFAGIPGLPQTVQLEPGTLRIIFDGAEDLLRQLYVLSQAIAEDFPRFQELVSRGNIEPAER